MNGVQTGMSDDEDMSEFLSEFTPQPSRARPLLKWVGGKTQLLPAILSAFPTQKVKTYYEPFIGGGAVFFAMASNSRFEQARLNDWNEELVNLYSVVRDDCTTLIQTLDTFQVRYEETPEQTYYDMRKTAYNLPYEQAARTIFLNKAGFNGLYRQNKAKQFNVPWSKKPKVGFYEKVNLQACSEALWTVDRFTTGDFEPAVIDAGPGDLVYMDPPYIPHSDTSNFTAYTADGFSMKDQERVAIVTKQLVERGVHVVVSNNDVPAIYDLYSGLDIQKVSARRNINSKGDKRGPVGEVLVVGRPSA